MRLVFVARGQSLRLGSAVTRGMDFADEVIVIGLEEDEEARSLVEAAGGTYIVHDQDSHAPLLARTLLDTVGECEQTVAMGWTIIGNCAACRIRWLSHVPAMTSTSPSNTVLTQRRRMSR